MSRGASALYPLCCPGSETDGTPKITVPTTVLHGEEDDASLVNSSEGQESSFTGGYRREVLSGVGHFIPRENPQAIIDAVMNTSA